MPYVKCSREWRITAGEYAGWIEFLQDRSEYAPAFGVRSRNSRTALEIGVQRSMFPVVAAVSAAEGPDGAGDTPASTEPTGQREGAFTVSVLGIGVDMVEVERIQHSLDRFGERFMKRVFTEGEIAYCLSMKFPARHFAARFAAKEAVSKAFGTGVGKAMGWRDIDVHKKKSGEPFLVLHGGAESLAKERAMKSAWISLSHTEHHAVAMVVIEA
jgi:holo-[acyl-carrier protein] synthase